MRLIIGRLHTCVLKYTGIECSITRIMRCCSFITLAGFSTSLRYRCATVAYIVAASGVLINQKTSKVLYKQLGVTVNSSMLQDGGAGFNTLIGFSLDLSALPKLSSISYKHMNGTALVLTKQFPDRSPPQTTLFAQCLNRLQPAKENSIYLHHFCAADSLLPSVSLSCMVTIQLLKCTIKII